MKAVMLRRVVLGSLAAALCLPPAAVAAADIGDSPLISTTCSYDQLVAALHVEDPDLAALLDDNPTAQAKLQSFVALPVDQRNKRIQDRLNANPDWRTTIEQKKDTPDGQEKVAMLGRIADTCHNY